MTVTETTDRLTARFGPINEVIDWYGVNEHGISAALEPLPHLINREGVFKETTHSSSALAASAYIVARLTNRTPSLDTHWAFGADMTDFGVVLTIGETDYAETILGKPFEAGVVESETRMKKALFVSPVGLLATVRQVVRGKRGDFVVNRAGMAELSIQELVSDAQAIVGERVATAE